MIIAYVKVGVFLHQSVHEAKAMNSSHEEKLKIDHLSSRIKVLIHFASYLLDSYLIKLISSCFNY